MNIYVRYFDHETITRSLDELLEFLEALREIPMTEEMVNELAEYINSDIPYPKRYKVRPRIYFILIKTTANTLEEFKANSKNANDDLPLPSFPEYPVRKEKEIRQSLLQEPREGWYLGEINFKRVILIPGTQKCQYSDTPFAAYVYANSAQDCYNRIIDHLRNRQDIDPRSQFPSARGSSFTYDFIGDEL